MSTERVKCLIIGSGPAGYTAAIYTGRANISPVLYEGIQPGGQLTITTEVENFPGYPEGISGTQLMDDLRAQAERFGVEIRTGIITKVDFSERPYKLTIDDEKEIEAETVIISTGASAKYLGLDDEKKYAPFISAIKQGTPASEKVSASTCNVTVLPVPVAPAIRPWRLAILPMMLIGPAAQWAT